MDAKLVLEQRKREIVILVGVILILFLILYFGSGLLPQRSVSLRFEKEEVRPADATDLFVEITNNGGEKAENVTVRIEPEYPLTVKPLSKVEPEIAAGSTRELRFGVTVNQTANPGRYRIDVFVDMAGKEEQATAYLRVKW